LADDHLTGSDHDIRKWQFGMDREKEEDDKKEVGWISAAITKNNAEVVENISMGILKASDHLDADSIENEVKEQGNWCQEAMSSVFEARAIILRICAKSKT
jgi:hypothetical protein